MRTRCQVITWSLGLAALAGLAIAQEHGVFKTGVSLVHVDAEVTDGMRLLTGFHKEDFKVFDNKQQQTILYLTQEETPLDLILLFDISGSMDPKLEKLARSAHVALAQLSPGDRVAVMVFSTDSTIVQRFTNDMQAVEDTINHQVLGKAEGGTHILRAVSDAADYFMREKRTERRRAVLIMTDNHGQPSGHRNTVVRALWEADALLCGLELRSAGETAALGVRSVISPGAAFMNMENMTSVVEETGGDLIKAHDPGPDFENMISRLRLRYMLVYELPKGKPGEHRNIKVELSEDAKKKYPQARVKARDGYYLPK
ncbi:MAG TPA: VWA domain-containing protein [Bryobacteraceae bacterium]|nr:VWA domain-containing protein [Bryobacteraceae bacterium]